jgi:hypothetical protein
VGWLGLEEESIGYHTESRRIYLGKPLKKWGGITVKCRSWSRSSCSRSRSRCVRVAFVLLSVAIVVVVVVVAVLFPEPC